MLKRSRSCHLLLLSGCRSAPRQCESTIINHLYETKARLQCMGKTFCRKNAGHTHSFLMPILLAQKAKEPGQDIEAQRSHGGAWALRRGLQSFQAGLIDRIKGLKGSGEPPPKRLGLYQVPTLACVSDFENDALTVSCTASFENAVLSQ